MKKSIMIRFILIGALALLSLMFLLPNTPYYKSMPKWWQDAMPDRGITMGLDLQGGLHLVFEVESDRAVELTMDRTAKSIKENAAKKDINAEVRRDGLNIIVSPPTDAMDKFIKDNYFYVDGDGNGVYKFNDDEIKRIKASAVDQALETIRNRIDQFGVAEPVIHRQGENEIVVQLPGVKDPDRAIALIGKTAQLEFMIVDDRNPLSAEFPQAIKAAEEEEFLKKISGRIPEGDVVLFRRIEDKSAGETFRQPYLLKKEVMLTGASLREARVSIDTRYNEPYVSITFDASGAKTFEDVTGAHVKERLAIVLDGNVHSAPEIREKIAGGDAQITGDFTMEEANDLAIVLRAGALPAPVKRLQNITVGPSLGRDSIEAGKMAGLVASILVVGFMIFYYRFSGLIADMALVLNIILLLGAMAMLKATLTMPGIAGVILAIGMAVDSNVLMFERMREELRSGKTPRAAVDSGYDKAFWTIFDSHVTTLITAVVLFQFGTGPIKGFAVTLSMGVAINLFTALVGTKTIFDFVNSRKEVKSLSI